jgi:hypothetical protein
MAVRVFQPHRLGIERPHQQLAFGVRIVELAGPDRHVAGYDVVTATRARVAVMPRRCVQVDGLCWGCG